MKKCENVEELGEVCKYLMFLSKGAKGKNDLIGLGKITRQTEIKRFPQPKERVALGLARLFGLPRDQGPYASLWSEKG